MSQFTDTSNRSRAKWGVCILLLLATMINYMDRLTLNQSAKRIMADLAFSEDRYGKLEGAFGAAFACGALLWLARRSSQRQLGLPVDGHRLVTCGNGFRIRPQFRGATRLPHCAGLL